MTHRTIIMLAAALAASACDPGGDMSFRQSERARLYRGEGTLDAGDPLVTVDPRITRGRKADRPSRWGSRILMSSENPNIAPSLPKTARPVATVIDTDLFEEPQAFLIDFRFQGANPSQGFTPLSNFWGNAVTADNTTFVFRRGVDVHGGMSDDVVVMRVGEIVPRRVILGHKLTVTIHLPNFPPAPAGPITSVWVEALAKPIDYIDDVDLMGAVNGSLGGYQTTTVTRRAANAAAAIELLTSDDTRRQFFIHNNSTQDCALLFTTAPLGVPAQSPSFAAGAELWTVLLPPGAQYESPVGGHTGSVWAIWRAADATGEALITSGTLP